MITERRPGPVVAGRLSADPPHHRALGLRVDAIESRISLVRPTLPPFLSRAKIMNLRAGKGCADLLVVRHENDVTVNILRRDGEIEVVVVM